MYDNQSKKMEGKKGSVMRRWLSIVVAEEGKEDEVFKLNAMEKHIKKFKRASRRVFPKEINSTTPKETILKMFQNPEQATTTVAALPIPIPSAFLQKTKPQEPQPSQKKNDEMSFLPEGRVQQDLESRDQEITFNPEIVLLEEYNCPPDFTPAAGFDQLPLQDDFNFSPYSL